MNTRELDILLVNEEDYPAPGVGYSALSRVRTAIIRATRYIDITMPPRMGLVLLATYAMNAGLKVAAVNNALSSPLRRLRFRRLLRGAPLAVGISTVMISDPETVRRIVSVIRRHSPGSIIILGGYGACHSPAMRKLADITVLGYGENALARLLSELKKGRGLDSVPGVERDEDGGRILRGGAYYEDGKIIFPDWGISNSLSKRLPVEGSRGCKYNCAFCTTSNRKRQVFRPPSEVFAEVANDIRVHGARQIDFVDSSFTSDPDFTTEFLGLLRNSGLKFSWTCFSRVDDFTRQQGLAGRMAEAGCALSYLGLESIHDDILDRMRKGYNRKTIEQALSSLEGLNVFINFIIGFPGDTEAKVKETVDFIESYSLNHVSIAPLYVPAELFEQARLDPGKFCHLRGEADTAWEHDTMNRARAVELAGWARRRLNRRRFVPVAY